MKDDQALEEKLISELDLMYQHVADTESCQTQGEHNQDASDRGQISEQEVQKLAKIIPFPGNRMPLVSEEPPEAPEEEGVQKRKPSYRTSLIVASFSLIFLVVVLAIIPFRGTKAPPDSERGNQKQLTFPTRSTPPASVQTEDVLQNTSERQQKAETMPRQTVQSKSASNQTMGSNSPFTTAKHYTVQVGAFRNWKNASERIDALQKKGLEPYWVETHGKNRGITYIVFSGYFTDRNEAAQFLKRKGIANHYPDSYVREISF